MQGRVTSQGRYARRVSPLLRSAMQPRSGRPDPRHRSGSAPAGGAHGAINARVPESAPVSAAGAGRRAACKRPGPWVAGPRCHPERCIVTGMQRSSWESIEPIAPTPINRAAITASPHWRRHCASREGRQQKQRLGASSSQYALHQCEISGRSCSRTGRRIARARFQVRRGPRRRWPHALSFT